MKKIMIGACMFLVTVMFSPAMAKDGPTERQDRQGDRVNKHLNRQEGRHGDLRTDRGNNHWRGKRSTHLANPRGYRGNHKYTRHYNRHRRHIYSRYNNRHHRHFYSRFKNRHGRHLHSGFYSRHNKHSYSRSNNSHYRHRKNW